MFSTKAGVSTILLKFSGNKSGETFFFSMTCRTIKYKIACQKIVY